MMRSIIIRASLMVVMSITPLAAQQSPREPIADTILKEIAQVWTVIVDEQNAKGGKLDDLFSVLAANQFFDIQAQAKLHPNYSQYMTSIDALRPSTTDRDRIVARTAIILGKNRAAINAAQKSIQTKPRNATYAAGGMLGILAVSIGLPIWWIRFRTRRTEKKMPLRANFDEHYRALIARMIWRYLVVIGSLLALILALAASNQYTEEQMSKHSLFFLLMVAVCLGVVLLYSRTLTKRRFVNLNAVPSK